MKGPLEILEFAMNMEKQGQNFYKSFADKITNPVGKKLFESLAKEEERHFNILKDAYEGIKGTNNWPDLETIKNLEDDNIFEIRKEAEKLSKDNLESSSADISILRMAYLIENDFAEFYKRAIENTDDKQGIEMLKTLYKWEDEHRKVFYEEYDKAMKNNWFDQGFAPF